MIKKALVLIALLFIISCTRTEPANPRPIPQIDISPSALPERPLYEPPPSAPEAESTTVTYEIEATRTDFLPSEIKVKKGSSVSLDILAVDIPQRFTLPSFGIDEPLPVGENVIIEFIADREGTYTFFSEDTPNMEGKIIVE